MGDPAGIGPEIAVKALSRTEVYSRCRPVLVGNSVIMQHIMDLLGSELSLHVIAAPEEALFRFGVLDVIELQADHPERITSGVVSAEGGDLAFRAIRKVIGLALDGRVDATVTCPVNKEALHAAGHRFSGHTEIYSHFTHTEKYAMLLADDRLKVIHVSTHVSLRKACDLVRKQRILETIFLMNEGLRRLGITNPRIGVAGLNPHSGENGLFGTEEKKEIIPAIAEARLSGIRVEGPVPPDSLFALAWGGRYDGCVAMYHDQGHIPFKFSGFEWDEERQSMKTVRGVNITLGLPIIRTSVDHGTAFEIAGKGIASPDALLHAIIYAVKLSQTKEQV